MTTTVAVSRAISEAEQSRIRSLAYADLHTETVESQDRIAAVLNAARDPENQHSVDFDRAAASGEFGDVKGSDLRQEVANRKDFTNYAEAVLREKAEVEQAEQAANRALPELTHSVESFARTGRVSVSPQAALTYLVEADGGTCAQAVADAIRALGNNQSNVVRLKNITPDHIKAVISTGSTTGVSVDRPRTGGVELLADRERTVAEVLPMVATHPDSDSYTFPREASKTNAADTLVENDTTGAADQAMATTDVVTTVRRVAASVQVTKEQTEDVAVAQSFINARLSENIRQKLEEQVVNGNGTAPNLTGLLNQTGIENQAGRTDSATTLITHMLTSIKKLWKDSNVRPNLLVVNFDDLATLMSTYSTNKELVWGAAISGAPTMLWGVPIITSAEMPANTAMALRTSDFFLVMKGGLELETGLVDKDLLKFRRSIVASVRANVGAFRPASLVKIVTTPHS